eukprot:5667612-Alexandrium_andersonii.AAC.1
MCQHHYSTCVSGTLRLLCHTHAINKAQGAPAREQRGNSAGIVREQRGNPFGRAGIVREHYGNSGGIVRKSRGG